MQRTLQSRSKTAADDLFSTTLLPGPRSKSGALQGFLSLFLCQSSRCNKPTHCVRSTVENIREASPLGQLTARFDRSKNACQKSTPTSLSASGSEHRLLRPGRYWTWGRDISSRQVARAL